MEKNMKTIVIIMIAMAAYFFLSRNQATKKAEEKVTYKPGTYYEKVEENTKGNGGFIVGIFSSIVNTFKKDKIEAPKEITDVLAITFTNDKISSITVDKGDNYLKDTEKVNQIINAYEKSEKFDEKDQKQAQLIVRAIEKARKKSIDSALEKKDKIKMGTFTSLIKNNDGYMETTANIMNDKIEKINVSQQGMTEQDSNAIDKLIKKVLNDRTIDVASLSTNTEAENTFIKSLDDIVDQSNVKISEYGKVKKSNVVWQTIKDVIAGLILGIQKFIKNYGISIIISTIIIKIILLPLTLKQDKSMKEMKKYQPELDEIKKKYKDPQLQQQKMMEVYKKHGINPAGGCLPLLIQMPILIALFGVLRGGFIPEIASTLKNVFNVGSFQTTVLNGFLIGPKFLWMDLVNPDPIYLLPILTGIVTYFQQKMMGSAGGDNPMMKNMGVIMPIMMVFISLKMPSGLQLYWLVSTILSVVQQYWIMKKGA